MGLLSDFLEEDEDPRVRKEALEALRIAGDATSLDVLNEVAVSDQDQEVRERAMEVIRTIRSRMELA